MNTHDLLDVLLYACLIESPLTRALRDVKEGKHVEELPDIHPITIRALKHSFMAKDIVESLEKEPSLTKIMQHIKQVCQFVEAPRCRVKLI